jgi:hypothetical protein
MRTSIESSNLFTEQHEHLLRNILFQLCGPVSSSVYTLLHKWERNHGTAWLVDRLAFLSLDLVGSPQLTISKNKDGSWKGPCRMLWTKAHESRRALRRVLRFFKLRKLVKAQITASDYEAIHYLDDFIICLESPNVSPYCVSRDKLLRPIVPKKHCYDYHIQQLYQGASMLEDYPNMEALYLPQPFLLQGEVVGQVHILNKDGALKKRVIFSPLFILQELLDPLYLQLKIHCSHISNMYHNDQQAGIDKVFELMQEGEAVSIDLLAASDSIPLYPQLSLLIDLFPHLEWEIDLFAKMARAKWKTPYGGLVKMTCGQPMGMKPSFLAFSLTLNVLLSEQFNRDDFCQVGDDLFIKDGHKAIGYLQSLGIPISLNKTVIGSYAMFCGTILDREGDLEVRAARTWMRMVRNFGTSVLKSAPPRYWFLATLAKFPPPIGFGWAPRIVSSVPWECLEELYPDKPEVHFEAGGLPPEELARYAELFINNVDLVPDQEPFRSFVLNSINTQGFSICRSRYSGLEPYLAETANIVVKDGLPMLIKHLETIGNLMGMQSFLCSSTYVETSNPFLEHHITIQIWKKLEKYFLSKPPKGVKHPVKTRDATNKTTAKVLVTTTNKPHKRPFKKGAGLPSRTQLKAGHCGTWENRNKDMLRKDCRKYSGYFNEYTCYCMEYDPNSAFAQGFFN